MKTLDIKEAKAIQGGLGNFPGFTAEMDAAVRKMIDAQIAAAGGPPRDYTREQLEGMLEARGETITNGGASKSPGKREK